MHSRQLNLLAADRRITRAKFWWDDFFAILCYVTAVGWAVVLPIWIQHGFGLHSDDVKGMSVIEANYLTKKYLFVIEHLYAFTLFFAKLSMLSFYWRMFRVANIQIIISIWLVCSIIWIIARTLLTTFHCYPVHAFWDPNVEKYTCPIKSSDFFIGTVLAHVIIDIGILILPVMQIQKLQLPRLQKVAIMLMFTFGTLVCVAGLVIVNISTKLDNNSLDMTWQLAPVIIWASVEVNLVTISACLPIIRPACLYLFSCQNPMPSSINSISNNYGRGCARSQIKQSIRLGTMPKEESSSTHELARPEQRGRDSFSSDLETDTDRRHGGITTAIGPGNPIESQKVPRLGSIIVTSETVVQVSKREYRR
ncbi:Ff.00g131150.m01.CDS01 [Fusarium sp. VM40]|nr:Ff.00g131150.m01.CDS01 [Fusarium sp. VM40]